MPLRLHRRQFWIGPAPEAPRLAGWLQHPLDGNCCLTYDPDLHVTTAQALDRSTWCLLGIAVQSDPTKPDPVLDIEGAPTAEAVAASTASWAGRWVLVGADLIQPDSGALRSCCFRPAISAPGVCVSSSAALLVAPAAPMVSAETNPSITYRVGMDWYPMPGARHVALARLLPSQTLRLSSGALSPRPLVASLDFPVPYLDVLERLAAYLTTTIRRAAEGVRGSVWVPLTAGYDSRLVLAAAVAARVPVRTFTSVFPTTPEYDRTLPPLLAAAVGVPHRFERWDRPCVYDPERRRIYDAHTAGQVVEPMRDAISRVPPESFGADDVVLHGTVFEVGRAFYYGKLPAGHPMEVPPDPRIISRGLGQAPHSSVLAALSAWTAWVRSTPCPGLDWRDRFYVEQRLAGWAGATMQGGDLLDPPRLPIANARAFFDLVLQVPADIRQQSGHHTDLIHRLAPGLAPFAFNPTPALHRRLLRAALLRWQRWRGQAGNA